jgi:nucleotide-binding universal stress UspA family protein
VKPKKILCPVDFSSPSTKALESAVELAVQFDASLSLLHVFQVPAVTLPDGVLFSADFAASVFDEINRQLREQEKLARKLGATRVDVAAIEGVPWRAIVDRALDGHYDLIVVGTHGRTGIRHAFVGSVAERVVRAAPCPVLTVRPVGESGKA